MTKAEIFIISYFITRAKEVMNGFEKAQQNRIKHIIYWYKKNRRLNLRKIDYSELRKGMKVYTIGSKSVKIANTCKDIHNIAYKIGKGGYWGKGYFCLDEYCYDYEPLFVKINNTK